MSWRFSIRNKIICGYALTLSVAVAGTTAGLIIGDRYQQQASTKRTAAEQQGILLRDLQIAMNQLRPSKEFVPLITKPREFQKQRSQVPERVATIKSIISELNSLATTANLEELQLLLQKCDRSTEASFQQLEMVLKQIELLGLKPDSEPAAKQLLAGFSSSLVIYENIKSASELTDFIKIAKYQQQKATLALANAEELRTQIIIGSMLLSVAIAAILAFLTSRAIAYPIEAVTKVAQQVIKDSNFNLQASVTTQDEIGQLATSFNNLIQQVASYTQQLELARQVLEQRVKERTQELLQNHQQLQQTHNQLSQTLQTLQQTQTQLIQTEKLSTLGLTIAGVAHEVNNPVNFIKGNITYANQYARDLLKLLHLYQQQYPIPTPAIQIQMEEIEIEFLEDDFIKTLSSMQIGADRICEIILALRNFSRSDEDKIECVNIHEGIDSTLLILNHRIKQGIEVVKKYGNLPLIECYPSQLNQVFMNILSNGIDAVVEQGMQNSDFIPRLQIQTEIRDNYQIAIAISDNGGGIPLEVKDKLFEPFFTTKPIGRGTGLGLPICQQIVEKHQGKIEVNSVPGQGTEFIIKLPISVSAIAHLA